MLQLHTTLPIESTKDARSRRRHDLHARSHFITLGKDDKLWFLFDQRTKRDGGTGCYLSSYNPEKVSYQFTGFQAVALDARPLPERITIRGRPVYRTGLRVTIGEVGIHGRRDDDPSANFTFFSVHPDLVGSREKIARQCLSTDWDDFIKR